VLRRFRRDDYAIADDVGEDPSTARWVNPLPGSDGAGAVRFFESERRRGSMLDLVIADSGNDGYLGEVLLFKREWDTGELAYVVAPFARGRGIATEAVKLLSGWAFDALGMHRLQLKVDPDTPPRTEWPRRLDFTAKGCSVLPSPSAEAAETRSFTLGSQAIPSLRSTFGRARQWPGTVKRHC